MCSVFFFFKQKTAYEMRISDWSSDVCSSDLASEKIDVTLPVSTGAQGSIHPISQVMDELAEIFADLGFAVATGPEIEDDWHNFTALNIPESPPSRAMHVTRSKECRVGKECISTCRIRWREYNEKQKN